MTDDGSADATVLATLAAVARRLDAAARIAPAANDALLSAIVATASVVLDAQAASIAVHDAVADRLVFVAGAGPAGLDVLGLGIDAATGIAGYAFTTGQQLAVADVTADPRFDRTVAEATGYVPASILATPLTDDDGTVGVLEVLDRRGGTFTMHDLEIAAALAREATIVVRNGRSARDAATLLRGALTALVAADPQGGDPPSLDEAAIETLVSAAMTPVAGDPDDPTWQLADRIARLREVDPGSVALAVEWLDALLRQRRR